MVEIIPSLVSLPITFNTYRMRIFHLLILLLLFCSKTTFSQTIDIVKLDAYFKALEDQRLFMGSVAMMKAGKLVYTQSIGYKDLAKQGRSDAQTRFRIGSISKTFTAVLILKAVDEKRITLDDKLSLFYPNILHADSITIRHLLSHRSGIHNYTDDSAYLHWYTKSHTDKEMLTIIQQGGSDFMPGSKASYSNANYFLLACILQRLYNQSYDLILTNQIIKPLGLKETMSGNAIRTDRNESHSYSFLSAWVKQPETHLSVAKGAGSIVSTPSDLVRFADALFSGRLIRSESLEQMKSMTDGFGLGLFAIPFFDKQGFGHTGGIDGFSSVFAYFPKDSIAYALTSNGSNMNNNDISITALSAIYQKPFDIPVVNAFYPKAEQLALYEGVYASETIPLKITIRQNGAVLFAQATGQPAIQMAFDQEHQFSFAKANLVLVFRLADHTMLLKQGGAEVVFRKE